MGKGEGERGDQFLGTGTAEEKREAEKQREKGERQAEKQKEKGTEREKGRGRERDGMRRAGQTCLRTGEA